MGSNKSGSYKRFRKRYLLEKSKDLPQYCNVCGQELLFGVHPTVNLSATIDHIKPISKGGGLKDLGNIRLCCYKCNCDKGDDYDND